MNANKFENCSLNMASIFFLTLQLLTWVLCFVHITGFIPNHSKISKVLRQYSSEGTYTRDIPKTVRKVPYTGEGCVLLSQPGEYDRYLIKSAILVYDFHPERGTLGLVLDKPSGFEVAEIAGGMELFRGNTVYTGGNGGHDTMIMVHAHPLHSDLCRAIGKGLYVGGLGKAKELIKMSDANARDFKFFFNNIQWSPGELERQVEEGRWDVCEAPPAQLLEQDPFEERPHYLWHVLRQALQLE